LNNAFFIVIHSQDRYSRLRLNISQKLTLIAFLIVFQRILCYDFKQGTIMRTFKRMLPYLIINILVSAATTLGVLYWWDQNRAVEPLPVVTQMTPIAANPEASPQPPRIIPTPPPLGEPIIEINNIFGVGDLETEAVRLQRLGEGELWLTGWQLKDGDGNVYIFPELLLNKDGAVEVNSRAGTDTVIELHWGLNQAAFRSGEEVSLVDPQGNLRSTFIIP
jgi:hypothetical protein